LHSSQDASDIVADREYHSDPELNAEDGSGTIDFTPQFAQ